MTISIPAGNAHSSKQHGSNRHQIVLVQDACDSSVGAWEADVDCYSRFRERDRNRPVRTA